MLLTEVAVFCLMFSTSRKEKEVKGLQDVSVPLPGQPVVSSSVSRIFGFAHEAILTVLLLCLPRVFKIIWGRL